MNRETLAELYFDYVNNYLTIEKWAEHLGLYPDEAQMLMQVIKSCADVDHPEITGEMK